MRTLTFILALLGLLGILGALMHPIQNHLEKQHAFVSRTKGEWSALGCSAKLDSALSLFVYTPSKECLSYSYALHGISNPFILFLGGDSNHYIP